MVDKEEGGIGVNDVFSHASMYVCVRDGFFGVGSTLLEVSLVYSSFFVLFS